MTTAVDIPRLTRMIESLDALIDHPRTPEHERAAAHTTRARLLALESRAVIDTRHGGHSPYTPTYGHKYADLPDHAPTKDIAAAIRADIALARTLAQQIPQEPGTQVQVLDPIGDAPAEITFGVQTQGHAKIRVLVRNIPADWGWMNRIGSDGIESGDWPSPALHALGTALALVMDAYNHHASDHLTDYHNQRFTAVVAAVYHGSGAVFEIGEKPGTTTPRN